MMDGYGHPGYAASLAEFGTVRELPCSGGWILKRQIPGYFHYDAMGCYPFFVCRDWKQLPAGLADLEGEIVSLSLVVDPFGDYDEQLLRFCFPDVLISFKEHFVIDLRLPLYASVSKHHRRYAERALAQLAVENCDDPTACIDDWVMLYQQLTERHTIRGIALFSRNSFEKQLKVPGMIAFRAICGMKVVGMLLWYLCDEVAYYHLGAYDSLGYEMRASFALFWRALEYFAARGITWINLGAGAGVHTKQQDGLARFKQGWSTGTRTAYLCGRIYDRGQYKAIAEAKGVGATDYFPAYRSGEFV